MNCQRFQNELFEYVDGTLSADALAAAQKHLAGCHACREAVKREQGIETALSSRLRQSSQTLTLRLEIRRNILAASMQKTSAPALAGTLIDFYKYWVRIVAIPAAMLLVAGILLAIHFSGRGNREAISPPVTPRLVTVTSPAEPNSERPVSVQMSWRLPRHEFHQEENVVLDAFVDETVVVNETIPSGSMKNLSRKLEFKTPL